MTRANKSSDAELAALEAELERLRPQIQLPPPALIRVIGVGGAGGNAINAMVRAGVRGVDFVAVNTDAQDLAGSLADERIVLGERCTRGLGAGGSADAGREAAEEAAEQVSAALAGSDMVFIAAGLGGGTGSGAAPVIARIARDSGALVVGVTTLPFSFEGAKRTQTAIGARGELAANVDALISVPNDRLVSTAGRSASLTSAFALADDVLRMGVQGISDIITVPGLINLDFADVRAIMANAGSALMGVGIGTGENRCETAVREALASPLLGTDVHHARGILMNVSGNSDIGLAEIAEAAGLLREIADADANIIFGTSIDERYGDSVHITIVATGFDRPEERPSFARPVVTPIQRDSAELFAKLREEADATRTERIATAFPVVASDADWADSDLDIPTFLRRNH